MDTTPAISNMNITRYNLVSNNEMGFAVIENEANTLLFKDEYEGGKAYELDFTYVKEFDTKKQAYDYIVKEYGKVRKIKK